MEMTKNQKNQKNKANREAQINRNIKDAKRSIDKAKRSLKAALRNKARFILRQEAAIK
jgi:hypothetical protein